MEDDRLCFWRETRMNGFGAKKWDVWVGPADFYGLRSFFINFYGLTSEGFSLYLAQILLLTKHTYFGMIV